MVEANGASPQVQPVRFRAGQLDAIYGGLWPICDAHPMIAKSAFTSRVDKRFCARCQANGVQIGR